MRDGCVVVDLLSFRPGPAAAIGLRPAASRWARKTRNWLHASDDSTWKTRFAFGITYLSDPDPLRATDRGNHQSQWLLALIPTCTGDSAGIGRLGLRLNRSATWQTSFGPRWGLWFSTRRGSSRITTSTWTSSQKGAALPPKVQRKRQRQMDALH